MFRPGPVTYCRPEPPCVVTDIPKRAYYTDEWLCYRHGLEQNIIALLHKYCQDGRVW